MNPRNHSIPRSANLIRLATLGAVTALLQTAESSTITYVGTETSNGSSYPVHDWSNASIAKSHDSDSNNAYGSAGYWQIRPSAAPGFAEGVGAGNDLGVSAGSAPTLALVPSFLSSISGGAGSYVNFGGYPTFRGPDGSSLYRQGALSVPVTEGPYDSPAGNDASHVGVPVQFALGSAGRFRLGLVVDAFNVGLWQNVGSQSVAPLSFITVDLLPDTAPPVLSYIIESGNFVLSWPAETIGWTLESSTDLGADDIWDPVPGVDNNSVSVPMTAPKNFF
jgi:hypothetical protein